MGKLTDGNTWTVFARLDLDGSLAFSQHDTSIRLEEAAPVEQFLASVAACFAKTCVNLMRHHQMPMSGVSALVTGSTPDGPLVGKGLDRAEIQVSFADVLDAAQQERLVADAKKLCTVSNSLSSALELTVWVGGRS